MAKVTETLKEGLESVGSGYEDFTQKLSQAVEQGTISVEDSYNAQVMALQYSATKTKELYGQVLASENLTTKERQSLNRDLTKALRDNSQEQLRVHREYLAEIQKNAEAEARIIEDQVRITANEQQWSKNN